MILEGIVTTRNVDRTVNISPMGPRVDAAMGHLVLRPYQTSTTYQNLKRTGQGVFHVTDDVLLLAQAAVGQPQPTPAMIEAAAIDGVILADACRWYAFRVEELDDSAERTRIECCVFASGVQREFLGFNRAKHAVLEAAILATRLHLSGKAAVQQELERLKSPIEKTAGAAEREAFQLLVEYVQRWRPS